MKVRIIDTILNIKSNAEVTVLDNNINKIEWHDGNPTNITNEQILNKQKELQALENVYENRRNDMVNFFISF